MVGDDALEDFFLEDRVGFFEFTILDKSLSLDKSGERFGEILMLFIILRDQSVDDLEAIFGGEVKGGERASQINV